MGRDVDERELVRRLTDPDPQVRKAAEASDLRHAFRPSLLSELGLLLADDTRSDSWPHAVHWLEQLTSDDRYEFAGLMMKLVPPTEHVPYAESAFVRHMSEDGYRALMAEMDVEWRTAARGITVGLGLAGHDEPPTFSPEPEPGRGPRLPLEGIVKRQTHDTAAETAVTARKLLQTRIEVSAGKIIRLEISRAPIILMPTTTVTAVSSAVRVL